MSVEQNKAVVRRLYDEVLNQGDRAVIDDIFAPDVTLYDPFTGVTHGPDSFRQILGIFDAAFPNHSVRVDLVLGEGDHVAVLHTHFGTHTGPFMGLPGTGKTVEVEGFELFKVEEGQITAFWRKDDNVGMLMQLGILPAPALA